MTNKDFCDYIQTQDSFKQMLSRYQPQLVFLSGSRGVGTNLPTSDYDLVAITNKGKIRSLMGYEEAFIYNNIGIIAHCYIYSLDYALSWLNDDLVFPKSIFSDLWFHNSIALSNKDNIIINTGINIIDFWIVNKDEIAIKCLYNLFTKHGPHQNKSVKFLCHCMLCLELVTHTNQKQEYIKKIKQQYRNMELLPETILMLWKELEQQWNNFLIQQK